MARETGNVDPDGDPSARTRVRKSISSSREPLFALEAFAALFTVAMQRVEDDGVRLTWGRISSTSTAFPPVVCNPEKICVASATGRRHLGSFAVGVEFRILGCDRDNLVVLLACVNHGHQANCACVDDGQRHHGFLAEHEHVEWVVVFCQRLRNETVVCRIVNGRVENAVEADQPARFIELIFTLEPKGISITQSNSCGSLSPGVTSCQG